MKEEYFIDFQVLYISLLCFLLPYKVFESLLTYPPSDKPSQPGTPEITDYDEESVGFRWAPSQSDGGSPITHYIIQMRLNGKDWERLDDLKTPTGNENLTYKHIGLALKDKVQYRTIAVNKAGESPPSEPSPVHTVKHKKRKFSTPLRHQLQIKTFFSICYNVLSSPDLSVLSIYISALDGQFLLHQNFLILFSLQMS